MYSRLQTYTLNQDEDGSIKVAKDKLPFGTSGKTQQSGQY